MAVSYNRLWKLLVDRKMSKADLRKASGVAPNTMTKLRRDEEVTLTVLGKICSTLNVDYGDIMEYIDERDDEEHDPGRMVGGRKKVISYFCRNGMASVMPFPPSSVHSAG